MSAADRVEIEIAVVGAGPVGLAAALAAQRRGYGVALVAPPRPPRRRAHLGAARRLGGTARTARRLASRSPARRRRCARMRIVDGTRRLIRAPEVAFHASEIGLDAFGYNIPNAVLVAALEAAVGEAADRRREAFVEAVEPGDAAVALTLSTGDDAGRPAGRRRRRPPLQGPRRRRHRRTQSWRYDQAALVVQSHATRSRTTTPRPSSTPSGARSRWFPCPASARAWSGSTGRRRWNGGWRSARTRSPPRSRRARNRCSAPIAHRRQAADVPALGHERAALRRRRVALAGEAAHLFPPIGAQGLNLGYRDVAALGRDPRRRPGRIPARTTCSPPTTAPGAATSSPGPTAVDALNRTLLSALPAGAGAARRRPVPARPRAAAAAPVPCARASPSGNGSAGRTSLTSRIRRRSPSRSR